MVRSGAHFGCAPLSIPSRVANLMRVTIGAVATDERVLCGPDFPRRYTATICCANLGPTANSSYMNRRRLKPPAALFVNPTRPSLDPQSQAAEVRGGALWRVQLFVLHEAQRSIRRAHVSKISSSKHYSWRNSDAARISAGREFLQRLNSSKDVFAIAMSGFDINADGARRCSVGYRQHLLKPFKVSEISYLAAVSYEESGNTRGELGDTNFRKQSDAPAARRAERKLAPGATRGY